MLATSQIKTLKILIKFNILYMNNFIKLCFIISLLFFYNFSFGQTEDYMNYYKHSIKAQTLFSQNQNESAIKEYDKAFLEAYPFPDDIIDAIKIHQELKNQVKINELLTLLVESGYKPDSEIPVYVEDENQYFKYIKPTYISIPEYKETLDSIHNLNLKDYQDNIDILKDNYLSVFKSYEFLIVHTRKFASKEDESKSRYLQKVLWSSTKDFLLNLYHSEQDISREKTDTWNDDLFINCLIHSAQVIDYRKDEYQKFLLEMVKQGNLHPYQYAIIIDDVERRLGNEQIYGTNTDPVGFDGDIEKYRNAEKQISSIKDIENVDERRKEIFLPPLWVTAKKYNFKLPENYKNK